MNRNFSILAAVFIGAGTLFGAGVPLGFSHANQLYAEGKFPQAARAYESILKSGAVSPNVLFDEGDAEFKCGNLGLAIAAFRRAALLSPLDGEIRANLDFARNQVQGPGWRENWWQSRLAVLSLNAWTVLAMIAFWLTFILFAAAQYRPAWKDALRAPARAMAAIALVLAACVAAAVTTHFSDPIAVVVLPRAVTHSGPFDDAQNIFAVHDGAELAVLDQRKGWVQVSDGSGRTGWIKRSQIEVLPVI
ncbi:MAG: tetratricopeptide repeat protein [Limisphaerales bacterium]